MAQRTVADSSKIKNDRTATSSYLPHAKDEIP